MGNNSSNNDRPPVEGVRSGATAGSLDDALEADVVYDVLSHPRRRYLCYTLLERTNWSLEDLATKIAAWENDVPLADVTDEQYEQVYASIVHAHVPRLVEEGVVTLDEESEVIGPDENTDQVLAALEGIGGSLDARQETHARRDKNDHGK